jgi:hypothetical protein
MLLLSLREKIKESDGESVVVGITADMDNIPTIRSGSFNLMPAYGYVRFILKHSKKRRPYSTTLSILIAEDSESPQPP